MLLQPRGWTPDDGSRAFHGARAKVATRSGDIFLTASNGAGTNRGIAKCRELFFPRRDLIRLVAERLAHRNG